MARNFDTDIYIDIATPIEVREIPSAENSTQKGFLGGINYTKVVSLENLESYLKKEYGYELLDISLNSDPKYTKELFFIRTKSTIYDDYLPKEITLIPRDFNIYTLL